MKSLVAAATFSVCIGIATAYGYILGRTTQIITYQEDLNRCESACESNGGVDDCRIDILCSCENGALFSELDLRK